MVSCDPIVLWCMFADIPRLEVHPDIDRRLVLGADQNEDLL